MSVHCTMTTSSVSLPPLDDVTRTLAGGIGERPVDRVFTAPSPLRAPIGNPGTSGGGEYRWRGFITGRGHDGDLPGAQACTRRVKSPPGRSGAWARSLACCWRWPDGCRRSLARCSATLDCSADCAYQLPVEFASVRFSAGLLLSRVTVAGGGGAMTNTSCWASSALVPACRE